MRSYVTYANTRDFSGNAGEGTVAFEIVGGM